MSRFNLMLGAAIAAILSGAASAQETPAPQSSPAPDRVLPPIRYSLPPGEGAQQPAPTPAPAIITPPTVPLPRATPKATPRPTPRPTPTPTPRAEPTPTPEPTQTPAAAEPVPIAPPAPVETRQPEPVPTATAQAPAPAPATESSRWPWIIGGALALLGLAGFFLWRRRDVQVAEVVVPSVAEPEAPPPPPPAPVPEPARLISPAPPPMPVVQPVPAGTITAFKDRPKPADLGYITAFKTPSAPAPTLEIEVNPIRAGIAEDAGFVEFQFAMINPSDVDVRDMLVSAWIMSANPEQDTQIVANLGEPADPSNHNIYALRPGEHRQHQATLGVPFDMLHVVEAAGRRFFAPMLLLDARYRSASGAPGRTSAAYMIGRPNPATGKLSPIYVDRGPIAVEGLAARAYPIPV